MLRTSELVGNIPAAIAISQPAKRTFKITVVLSVCLSFVLLDESTFPGPVSFHSPTDIVKSQRVFFVEDPFEHIVKINNSLQT